jgi:hypothetical protein
VELQRSVELHLRLLACGSRGDATRHIGAVGAPAILALFKNDHVLLHFFKPACLNILA